MSRVLYPFNFVPNGQIYDGMNINYSPCFIKRTTQAIGTRTPRPIGLTLTDAMRLAWIVRSFKIDFINTPQQEVYMYSNNDAGYFPAVPPPFAPPDDEKFLVCCGFSDPSRIPTWGPTFFETQFQVSYLYQIYIGEPRAWIADGYPTIQNPNPNFNPITDLTIYPIIVIYLSSQGPTPGTTYVATTSTVSNSPKVSGVFLPKSAGFSKDYELDYYKGNQSFTLNAAPTFTFDNFWEYRDENGENPIWNKTTGARM
jgi:hypothetical protein